ncbi:hypothetical protein EVAR_22085_1 [Eumeta japonica]|uniref:Uncharacterized protein n=1 Tax=Eumeta variegata TaxID=151549 RepID=A0A4C1USM2_EUMVA|nr:hypothetical protein EVAR_22085_1 [Eumeta japonica]
MGRPTVCATHTSHPHYEPLRSSIDHHVRLRQLLDHNDVTRYWLEYREPQFRTRRSAGAGPSRHIGNNSMERTPAEINLMLRAPALALFSKSNRNCRHDRRLKTRLNNNKQLDGRPPAHPPARPGRPAPCVSRANKPPLKQ